MTSSTTIYCCPICGLERETWGWCPLDGMRLEAPFERETAKDAHLLTAQAVGLAMVERALRREA